MTIQVVVNPYDDTKYYPRRGDRQSQKPSNENAQGLFPPSACVFVGNLSTKVPLETLAEDLKEKFSAFGTCHVKIKQDKKKGLPGAFVQFEAMEAAETALTWNECTMLHGRWLRIERSRGRRTACLGLRDGMPITPTEVLQVLKGKGPLEVYSIVATPYFYDPWMNVYTYTYVCNVTFAYVDDCKDAIKYFKNDFRYYMILLDVDGNPLLPTVPDSNSNSNSNLMEDLVGKAPETPRSQDVLYEIRDKGNVWYPDQVGRKVEKYVRTAYEQGEDDLDDEQIMSVVQDLEKYQKTKGRLGDWYNGDVPRHWEMQPAAPPAPTTEDSSESSQSLDGSEDVSKAAEVEDKNAEGDKEKDEMNDNDNETDKNDGDTKGKDDDKKDVDGPEKTNDSDSDGNNTKEDPRTEKLNN